MKKRTILYESIFAILALIVVVLALADMMNKIPAHFHQGYIITDRIILIIFAVDYFYRLYKADNKRTFFKENIFDLIAIMPFDSFFRGLRLVRLFRLLKLLKVFVYWGRFSKRTKEFLRTNGFLYILYFTVISIFIGSVLIYFAEKNLTIHSFSDAVWWAFVTTTTVGYGDISPQSTQGRLIAAILMLIGIGFISMLTGTVATFFLNGVKKKEKHENQILDLTDLSEEQFRSVADYVDYIKTHSAIH